MALVCLAAVLSAAPVESEAAPEIVAFGDSLTSGRGLPSHQAFSALLQKRIAAAGLPHHVVNAGISGDTTSRAVARFERALNHNVRVVIVALGANDGLRGVPVARLKANLSTIIESAQARGIAVLLCAMEALPIYGWDYSADFHRAFRELSSQYDVPLVPFVLRNVIADPDLMQRDHVHPNAAGARVIADNIWPYLEPLLRTTKTAAR